MTAVWIALAILLVAMLAGVAYAAVHGVKMARAIKRLSRTSSAERQKLSASSEQMSRKLERTTASLALLDKRMAHFNVTRERASALTSALAEVQETLTRARALIPSKTLPR
jgi:cell division protein FtsB